MAYRWVQNPGGPGAIDELQGGMAGNRVAGAARRAGRYSRMIAGGRGEELGFLQSPDLAGSLDSIRSSYADNAFADSPEQQQEAMQIRMRQARQDAGLNNIRRQNDIFMGLMGMQQQGQENKMNRDLSYRSLIAKTMMDQNSREQYTSGWNLFGGLLAGGLRGLGSVMSGM